MIKEEYIVRVMVEGPDGKTHISEIPHASLSEAKEEFAELEKGIITPFPSGFKPFSSNLCRLVRPLDIIYRAFRFEKIDEDGYFVEVGAA